jgi:hypothetical protein
MRVLGKKYQFLASTCTCQNSLFWKIARLARLADIRQAILAYLPNLHSPKIKFHDTRQTQQHLANLANVLI